MSLKPMGMILSAGYGTRLAPLTHYLPKPQLELFGKPIIFHLLDQMKNSGISDVIINLHYMHEKLSKILSNYNGLRLHLLYEKDILGTAGAVKNAVEKLNIKNQDLIVVHGDILCDFDFKKIFEERNFCTLLCSKDQSISGYSGNIETDKNGYITKLGKYYHSAQESFENGFFTGVQLLSKDAVGEIISIKGSSLVQDIYPVWIQEKKQIKALVKKFYYNDLGSVKRLFESNMYYLNQQKNIIHNQKTDTNIIEPVFMLNGIKFGKNCQIGPNVIIGQNCNIEDSAVIRNSVIMSNTKIKEGEILDSVIAISNDCRVKIES